MAPFAVRNVQTDNGSEFAMHFHDRCSQVGLTHFFNFPSGRTFSVNPKHPQSNGYLERFNRTIQEQFVYLYEHHLDDLPVFDLMLMEYLICLHSYEHSCEYKWYNTEKPRRGIGKTAPMRFFLDDFISPQKSNMLWTLTVYLPRQNCSGKIIFRRAG